MWAAWSIRSPVWAPHRASLPGEQRQRVYMVTAESETLNRRPLNLEVRAYVMIVACRKRYRQQKDVSDNVNLTQPPTHLIVMCPLNTAFKLVHSLPLP